ncbi:MAG TPA: sugar phosphate isomerase/epimerase [Clostridiales bacterium]|jgi:inosose dehydratase|nr:sugar phosphate isomerase/epimerase [Clostridiales bacterium]
MKFGVSTYSLVNAIGAGEMTVLDVIEWIAENGGEHVEIVPFGFQLMDNEELIDQIKEKAKEVGIDISNYAILADLVKEDEEEYEAEVHRVINEVDIAHRLGVKLMRHDVSAFRRPFDKNGIDNFEKDLPKMVDACRRIADYAAQYGITTTVENHGFYVNGSDRVQRLITQVNRPNYKQTVDVGNFWCIDEEPLVGVKKNISNAAMIHLKDFYYRPASKFPGPGTMFKCDSGTWFKTITGNLLRGAIVGDGDIDMWEILRVIKQSGYDGYISLEFEGLEDCRVGTATGLRNAKYIWKNI